MKKISKENLSMILPLNIAVIIVMAVLICSAVSDAIEAKKIEDALAGGYEGILSYENRPDYGAFVSKEAFMEVYSKTIEISRRGRVKICIYDFYEVRAAKSPRLRV